MRLKCNENEKWFYIEKYLFYVQEITMKCDVNIVSMEVVVKWR